MGQLALGLNGLIILGSGLAYQSLDAVLYGAVATFTSSTVMDNFYTVPVPASWRLSLLQTERQRQRPST